MPLGKVVPLPEGRQPLSGFCNCFSFHLPPFFGCHSSFFTSIVSRKPVGKVPSVSRSLLRASRNREIVISQVDPFTLAHSLPHVGQLLNFPSSSRFPISRRDEISNSLPQCLHLNLSERISESSMNFLVSLVMRRPPPNPLRSRSPSPLPLPSPGQR